MVKFFRFFSLALLIAWMGFIFYLSAETAAESTKTSGGLIESVLRWIYSDFKNLPESEQQSLIETLQFIVRKLAHFTLYGILGLLSFLTFVTYNKLSLLRRTRNSLLVCFVYAVSDEIHQYFIPGRSCEIRDVLIDFSGSVLVIILAYFITRKFFNKNIKAGRKMLKKELLKLSEELFLKNEENLKTIEALKSEIEQLKKDIENNKKEPICDIPLIEDTKDEEFIIPTQTQSEDTTELLMTDQAYGASVIGKIIVSATKLCNSLSLNSDSSKVKDQINLILGRTEVAKVQILKIISQDETIDRKKELMDTERQVAEDYFKSVMAQ